MYINFTFRTQYFAESEYFCYEFQDAPRSPHKEHQVHTSPSHIYVETPRSYEFPEAGSYCVDSWPQVGDPWSSGPLTIESLKRIELTTDDFVSSRSSSQFHESGFGSQSIDEVSFAVFTLLFISSNHAMNYNQIITTLALTCSLSSITRLLLLLTV